jgi:hypothetical protein
MVPEIQPRYLVVGYFDFQRLEISVISQNLEGDLCVSHFSNSKPAISLTSASISRSRSVALDTATWSINQSDQTQPPCSVSNSSTAQRS